jgi:hypothetical protein
LPGLLVDLPELAVPLGQLRIEPDGLLELGQREVQILLGQRLVTLGQTHVGVLLLPGACRAPQR